VTKQGKRRAPPVYQPATTVRRPAPCLPLRCRLGSSVDILDRCEGRHRPSKLHLTVFRDVGAREGARVLLPARLKMGRAGAMGPGRKTQGSRVAFGLNRGRVPACTMSGLSPCTRCSSL
jgi:hypothetical protein